MEMRERTTSKLLAAIRAAKVEGIPATKDYLIEKLGLCGTTVDDGLHRLLGCGEIDRQRMPCEGRGAPRYHYFWAPPKVLFPAPDSV